MSRLPAFCLRSSAVGSRSGRAPLSGWRRFRCWSRWSDSPPPTSCTPAGPSWPSPGGAGCVRPGLALGRFLNDVVEPRVIDGAVNAVADFFLVEAREFRLIQTGRVRSYALWTLGGAIGVVLVVAAFLGYLPVRFG